MSRLDGFWGNLLAFIGIVGLILFVGEVILVVFILLASISSSYNPVAEEPARFRKVEVIPPNTTLYEDTKTGDVWISSPLHWHKIEEGGEER